MQQRLCDTTLSSSNQPVVLCKLSGGHIRYRLRVGLSARGRVHLGDNLCRSERPRLDRPPFKERKLICLTITQSGNAAPTDGRHEPRTFLILNGAHSDKLRFKPCSFRRFGVRGRLFSGLLHFRLLRRRLISVLVLGCIAWLLTSILCDQRSN